MTESEIAIAVTMLFVGVFIGFMVLPVTRLFGAAGKTDKMLQKELDELKNEI